MTDFGFACYFKAGEKINLPLGTPSYMAPEIIQEKEYDEKVDTWSVGIMTYEMIFGETPFYRPGIT